MPQTAPSLDSVRLPRAIRERSERIAAMTEPPADPPLEGEVPPPTPTVPEPAPPADPRESDPQYWAQRFRVTQGMLERERRERIADQERLNETVTELREQLRNQPKPTPATDLKQFFTDEQIEQYGEDQCRTLADVAIKAAREQTQAAVSEAIAPIREQQEQAQQNAKREKQAAFLSALAEQVPDYEAVNADQGWLDWLAEVDEGTGFVRQEVLNKHVADGRADLTARLFQAYKATRAAPPAPPVAPGNRAGPPAAPPAQPSPVKGYPTKTEIRDYYKRAAIGKVSDKERTEFEARLQSQPAAA
jgi:hypothetical protein